MSPGMMTGWPKARVARSEEHTSELQSRLHLVCRLLLEKKKTQHVEHRNCIGVLLDWLDLTQGLVAQFFFFFNDTATTEIYTLSLHDALPISAASFTTRSGPVTSVAGRNAEA